MCSSAVRQHSNTELAGENEKNKKAGFWKHYKKAGEKL